MEWTAIQRDAKAKGVLVYAISQAQTAPVTQPGPWGVAGEGYCMGLAANWIAVTYQGKDFDFSNQVCDEPPWQATMAQNVYDDADSTDWVGEWKIILAPFSCTVTGNKAERAHPPSAAFLCQVVFGAYGCYAVTLTRPGGGHAVAFCNGRDGRLHLFDPNYFHVAVKGRDAFQDFVSWWLEQTGYDKRYTDHTGIVGIRPPINHTHP
jgi:hypothetical protein